MMFSILLKKFKKLFAKYLLIGVPAWVIYEEVKHFFNPQQVGEVVCPKLKK